jgi:hypothetical protein
VSPDEIRQDQIRTLRAMVDLLEANEELDPIVPTLYVESIAAWKKFSADTELTIVDQRAWDTSHYANGRSTGSWRQLVRRSDGVEAWVPEAYLPPAVCAGSELPSEVGR